MLWLALHLPMLGLEERLGTFDVDTSAPAVLVADNRIVQVNESARKAEIALGGTLATANSILPGLKAFSRDPSAEHERLAMLAEVAYRYTPRVSPAPPDALLLEVRGSLGLFGGLQALVDGLVADCQRLGHGPGLAVATTPLASLILARAGSRNVSEASAEKPIETALRDVPLVHSDLSPKDLERLANMGITRFDELLTLPKGELGKRFGPALIDYLVRLTGQKADPRAFIEPRERFQSSVHLLEPVRGKDALLFPMRRLAAELARWLARRRFGARLLIWTVKPLTGPAAVLTVEFAQPRRDDQSFLALSRLKLDSVDLPAEAMSVSLRADFIAPFTTPFTDLFGMAENNAPGHAELVDLLAAKLGGEAVRGLRFVDDHRPEHATGHPVSQGAGHLDSLSALDVRTQVANGTAFRTALQRLRYSGDALGACAVEVRGKRNFHPSVRMGRDRQVALVGSDLALGYSRPMWLLDPPKPIDAKPYELVSGPERIETGWWERDRCAVARDYYVAYSKHGAKCWLYREQREQREQNSRWFLHGYFA